MKKIAILGLTWGNEGKSRIIRFLARNQAITALCETNPNKINTIVEGSEEFEYTYLPSGVFNSGHNIITSGAFICPITLVDEISACGVEPSKLLVSQDSLMLLSYHFNNLKAPQVLLYEDLLNGNAFFIRDLYQDNFKNRLLQVVAEKNKLRKNEGHSLIDVEDLFYNLTCASNLLKSYLLPKGETPAEQISQVAKTLYYETRIGLLDSLPFGAYPFTSFINNSLGNLYGYSKNSFKELTECLGVTRAFMLKGNSDLILPTLIQNESVYTFLESQNIKDTEFNKNLQIGWFDSVIIRYLTRSLKIKKICITSLEKLTGLDRIKLCISYSLDGEKIDYLPTNPNVYARIVPNYIEVPGWKEDLSLCKKYSDLPSTVKYYIKKIEQYTKCKVSIISFGSNDKHIARKGVLTK